MNFSQFGNPYNTGFKRYILALIGENDYSINERSIDELAKIISSEDEYKRFGVLMQTAWESGFRRAVDQNLDNLKKLGIKANIVYKEEKSG
jgi:hypothetical protein